MLSLRLRLRPLGSKECIQAKAKQRRSPPARHKRERTWAARPASRALACSRARPSMELTCARAAGGGRPLGHLGSRRQHFCRCLPRQPEARSTGTRGSRPGRHLQAAAGAAGSGAERPPAGQQRERGAHLVHVAQRRKHRVVLGPPLPGVQAAGAAVARLGVDLHAAAGGGAAGSSGFGGGARWAAAGRLSPPIGRSPGGADVQLRGWLGRQNRIDRRQEEGGRRCQPPEPKNALRGP